MVAYQPDTKGCFSNTAPNMLDGMKKGTMKKKKKKCKDNKLMLTNIPVSHICELQLKFLVMKIQFGINPKLRMFC